MCKKYKLEAKRACETVFTDWCSTDDGEIVKRNIKTIEILGWQWRVTMGDQEGVENNENN